MLYKSATPPKLNRNNKAWYKRINFFIKAIIKKIQTPNNSPFGTFRYFREGDGGK